jgi:hypothetical protein
VENTSNLVPDLAFYQRWIYKRLGSHFVDMTKLYGLPWQLLEVYFPWERCFEIGFVFE